MRFFYKKHPAAPKVLEINCSMPVMVPYMEQHHEAINLEVVARGGVMQEPEKTDERQWVMLERWRGEAWTDCGVIRVSIDIGGMTDLASIPGAAEGLEKRDDRNGLIGALFHDAFFAVGYPCFEVSNDLFYQIMRLEGMGWWKARRRWAGVNSPFGRIAWDRSRDEEKTEYEKRWFHVTEVPK